MSKYLSCAETAKMVRKALAEAFPGVKFSVRSSVYAGGASIRVNWIDGPNTKQVEGIAETFSGSYFDGMIDYKGAIRNMIGGEVVRFGADFIFCNREHSDAAIERAILAVKRRWGAREYTVEPTVANFRNNRLWNCMPAGSDYFDFQREVGLRLTKVSDRFAPAKSSTAGAVIHLGNDGYSQHGALDASAL